MGKRSTYPHIAGQHRISHQVGGADPLVLTGLVGAATKFVVGRYDNVVGGVSSYIDDLAIYTLNSDGDYYSASIDVPWDFNSLVEAYILVHCSAAKIGLDLDLSSGYGKVNEAYNTHSESNTAITFDIAANVYTKIDVSSVLTGIEAGDVVRLKLTLREAYNLAIKYYRNFYVQYV